jgi:predicted TIM-barrel fold metal-dependent hydrolase
MGRTYNVVDADAHVLEPPNFWADYIDPAYKDRVPELIVDTDGKERLQIEGKIYGGAKGLGFAGAIGARQGETSTDIKYIDGRKGGFDPHARIPDMDLDNIDAAYLYPTLGLLSGGVQDPALASAICRAYNRWLADYCKPYPDRLFGVAMLPMQDIGMAIEEMRYARNELGMKTGFLRPNPYNNRMLGHRDYDPFWAEAQELDFGIGVHEGTGGMPAAGADRFEDLAPRHIVSHTVEMMLASLSIIWDGVCERYPKIRLGFMESGGGWIAPWLDRMDRHYDDHGVFSKSTLKMRPTDYFKRQCWISYEPVEGSLAYLVDYIGAERILWATDYPHPDGFFPGAPAQIAAKLSDENKHKVLAESAKAFYQLN